MKRLLLVITSALLLSVGPSSYGLSYIAGPGATAFMDTGTGLHTAGGWGRWYGLGGVRCYQILISKEPPANGRIKPIFAKLVAPWKTSFVIYVLPPGTYYCVVWPNGLWGGQASGVHQFVSKRI